MLAYIFWHSPARDVDSAAYEQGLERFHRSLAHRPPSGLRGSAVFRTEAPPWTMDGGDGTPSRPAYEDWYLLDSWSAIGVLEEAALAQGHASAHAAIARLARPGAGAIYRLGEGSADLADASMAVWIAPGEEHSSPTVADLLGDGMDGATAGLWRRCLVLGPAPEYCVLGDRPVAGVAASRLPAGWRATSLEREILWSS